MDTPTNDYIVSMELDKHIETITVPATSARNVFEVIDSTNLKYDEINSVIKK